MTGRERVLNTLSFQGADRIPVDLWILPAARMRHGEALDRLLEENETDFASLAGPFDHGFTPEYYQPGRFTDPWGSEWNNIQPGVIGEVKKPVFADYAALEGYQAPAERFLAEWQREKTALAMRLAKARLRGKFVIGGWISLFERFQYLRGTEELYCDLALDEPDMYRMMALVMDFMRAYVDAWLEMDIDAVAFGDDWGTQISLLISPELWKRIFKPMYRELIDRVKQAGKKVFFHSDGYIFDLYPEFIDLGVDALNSQLWCMGVEKVAREFAGKITFWGEISRQTILPHGTPEDVRNAARQMKALLCTGGGGLIGQSEINRDVPLENVEAFLKAWR